MKRLAPYLLVGIVLLVLVFAYLWTEPMAEQTIDGSVSVNAKANTAVLAVLDISVHSLEEIKVLFDLAEGMAMRPRAKDENASVVLVLHGPEVEFFSIKNYATYKDLVDQAARLDAFDIVDVKICQTMMGLQGLEADDIPAFIEQVPLGASEIERLVRKGYVAF